jgi:hypothetical protein
MFTSNKTEKEKASEHTGAFLCCRRAEHARYFSLPKQQTSHSSPADATVIESAPASELISTLLRETKTARHLNPAPRTHRAVIIARIGNSPASMCLTVLLDRHGIRRQLAAGAVLSRCDKLAHGFLNRLDQRMSGGIGGEPAKVISR